MNTAIMKIFPSAAIAMVLTVIGGIAGPLSAQGPAGERFDGAASQVDRRLEEAIAELAALRDQIAAETIPRSRTLSELEQQLIEVRAEYQSAARLFDNRTLEVSNLTREIKARSDEVGYLSNLLSEYARNFEARLHIAELQRHRESLAAVRLLSEGAGAEATDPSTGFETQLALIVESIDRLDEALGGTRFEGTVVDPEGIVRAGRFALLGPVAVFRSEDGIHVGTAEQRLGSLEPTLIPFLDPIDVAAASALIERGTGELPLDPTLGSAHRVAATEETLLEHIKAGGPVMVPIFALAGAALLVALYKFVRFLFIRRPSKRALRDLMQAVAAHEHAGAARSARRVGGPAGRMLVAGVEHLGHSRELIEEVMYEVVLQTRLKLQRMLPFIAICAAAAPLLGLLGTVTGIITTFKLITIFGSGDVKTLSGGISQALITTEYGLIVAIPALLMHALLSRKAKGITDQMEIVAMQLVNQIAKSEVDPKSTHSRGAAPPANPGNDASGEVEEDATSDMVGAGAAAGVHARSPAGATIEARSGQRRPDTGVRAASLHVDSSAHSDPDDSTAEDSGAPLGTAVRTPARTTTGGIAQHDSRAASGGAPATR